MARTRGLHQKICANQRKTSQLGYFLRGIQAFLTAREWQLIKLSATTKSGRRNHNAIARIRKDCKNSVTYVCLFECVVQVAKCHAIAAQLIKTSSACKPVNCRNDSAQRKKVRLCFWLRWRRVDFEAVGNDTCAKQRMLTVNFYFFFFFGAKCKFKEKSYKKLLQQDPQLKKKRNLDRKQKESV